MPQSECIVSADDGSRLFVRHLTPDGSAAARTLVIVHGAAEHGGRYLHFAQVANERGWNVVLPDSRGHGRSGGTPVHVDSFEQYLNDLDRITAEFKLDASQTALLGHSTGGLISIRYSESRPGRFLCLVALSPLLGIAVQISPLKLLAGRVLSRLVPYTRFRLGLDPCDLTHDNERLQRRANDQLMHSSVTARWYVEVETQIAAAHAAAAGVRLPLLLLQGGADRVVSPAAAQRWFDAVGSQDKTMQVLPDHWHELLNEPDWLQTATTILNWLDARLPA